MPKEIDIFAKLKELNAVRKKAIRQLLKERRKLDRQLAKLGYEGSTRPKQSRRICSNCGKSGHNTRTCQVDRKPRK